MYLGEPKFGIAKLYLQLLVISVLGTNSSPWFGTLQQVVEVTSVFGTFIGSGLIGLVLL